MTKLKLTRFTLVMLMSLTIVESALNKQTNNWFTKSMDYFHFEECSSQDKSDLTGKFYGCLNSGPAASSGNGAGGAGDYSKYYKDYMGYTSGMSGGANALNPSIPDYMNKYNPQNKKSESNGFQGDKKEVNKDGWAFKLCE